VNRDAYQAWRARIWVANSRLAMTALYEALCALPPDHERAELLQLFVLRWEHVAPGHSLPYPLPESEP
jgi:hypothetical protein